MRAALVDAICGAATKYHEELIGMTGKKYPQYRWNSKRDNIALFAPGSRIFIAHTNRDGFRKTLCYAEDLFYVTVNPRIGVGSRTTLMSDRIRLAANPRVRPDMKTKMVMYMPRIKTLIAGLDCEAMQELKD
jgi:hypothetical protein